MARLCWMGPNMALFKGRLFAGALFAGALLGAAEPVVEPPVQQVVQVRQGGRGSGSSFDEAGSSWASPGHTWVKLHRVVRYGGSAPQALAQVSCGSQAQGAGGQAGCSPVSTASGANLIVAVAPGSGGSFRAQAGVVAGVVAGSGTPHLAHAPPVRIEFIDVDEILALMVA